MQKPTIGRIVHFVDYNNQHNAAIVIGPDNGSGVSLEVFGKREDHERFWGEVIYDASGSAARSWHWPEVEPVLPGSVFPYVPLGGSVEYPTKK